MEYEFEEERESVENIIRKVKVISVLLTGMDLVPVKSISEFTEKLIYGILRKTYPEKFLSEHIKYHLCDSLYIEGKEVVAYLDNDFVDNVFERFVTEGVFYTLFNTTLPELFPEYEGEFLDCYNILGEGSELEFVKRFFNIINKLRKDNELKIDKGELKEAIEEVNEAVGYNYLDFIREFLRIVFDLLERYVDADEVYEFSDGVISEKADEYLESIREHINNLLSDIVYVIEYTRDREIKIMFDSPDELYMPNFTGVFHEIEGMLDNCITTLKDRFEKVTSAEEIIKDLTFGDSLEDDLMIYLVSIISEGGTVDETEIISTLINLVLKLQFYVDDVYPTELSLEICDLLEEIKVEQGYGI